ncbi:hypothetical protein XELAEV_18019532mg [Xenopus laevis]|uniref:Uncharacterized protein n=1 Tax=Xenopus laevis TaxID=8355 RepID=A0A974DH33_XENLA|nr:hypothetical protein XELAEV_18019532mg [Xenopus laevis]
MFFNVSINSGFYFMKKLFLLVLAPIISPLVSRTPSHAQLCHSPSPNPHKSLLHPSWHPLCHSDPGS